MKKVFRLAKPTRNLLLISSSGLTLLFFFMLVFGNPTGGVNELIWAFLIIMGIAISGFYGAFNTRLIISSEGLENFSGFIRVKAAWNQVEKIEINPFGIINLHFKEPIYQPRLFKKLVTSLGYDRMIQISLYIEDLATSDLLKEISQYVLSEAISDLMSIQKPGPPYRYKPAAIGGYYLLWLFLAVVVAYVLKKLELHLALLGFTNTAILTRFTTGTLTFGLFFNGFKLIAFDAETAGLEIGQIAPKARAYYLTPVVLLLIGAFGSLIVWLFTLMTNIVLTEKSFPLFNLTPLLLVPLSVKMSSYIEKMFFNHPE